MMDNVFCVVMTINHWILVVEGRVGIPSLMARAIGIGGKLTPSPQAVYGTISVECHLIYLRLFCGCGLVIGMLSAACLPNRP